MKRKFKDVKIPVETATLIRDINRIVGKFQKQGLILSIRQLFYQFVAEDVFPNKEKYYSKLSRVVTLGRRCGKIDHDMFEDRLRIERVAHRYDHAVERKVFDNPHEGFVEPEIWIEKYALAGIVEQVCGPLCVTYVPCEGQISDNVAWRFSKRYFESGRNLQILYLGDHDPSGLQIYKSICNMIGTYKVDMVPKRIAITKEQIKKFNPPPNPSKMSDSNFRKYVNQHGPHSYEVDALNPKTLRDIIKAEILKLRKEKR